MTNKLAELIKDTTRSVQMWCKFHDECFDGLNASYDEWVKDVSLSIIDHLIEEMEKEDKYDWPQPFQISNDYVMWWKDSKKKWKEYLSEAREEINNNQ